MGGVVTALYTPKSEFPFNFMFSKGEKYKACLPCQSLAECWEWADKVRLDNIN